MSQAVAARAVEAWKRVVPRRQQQMVIEARVAARRAYDPRRPLPELLVIGAQRSGTSSLYKYLEQHPCVLASLRKETEYLSSRWDFGEAWYRAHFPSRARRLLERRRTGRPPVTFEASPNYVFHPLSPGRAARLVPQAKLVVLLRDPVQRAFSHHQHEVRAGREALGLEEALDREHDRLAGEEERLVAEPGYRSLAWERCSYQARGHYADQLQRWMQHFPAERLHVIRSEDLYADPAGIYAALLRFLGLPAWAPSTFRNFSYAQAPLAPLPPMAPSVRARLVEAFAYPNERLAELLGRDFGWE